MQERTITNRKLQRLAARVNHQRDRRAADKLRTVRAASPAEIEHAISRSFSLRDAFDDIDRGRV